MATKSKKSIGTALVGDDKHSGTNINIITIRFLLTTVASRLVLCTYDAQRKIFETGSILLYLAELSGKFIPNDPAKRTDCFNWLFFSVSSTDQIIE